MVTGQNQCKESSSHQKKDWIISTGVPIALFVLPFGIYLATTAPGITWAHEGADGGDLITAAYALGIPHPPGYPLYVLLGKFFSLLPIGNVAYRLNLLSAFCAALTIVVLYLWMQSWLRRMSPETDAKLVTLVAAAASLLLAFSRLFWSQAIIAEVYALNALAVVICLSLLWRWDTTDSSSAVELLAYRATWAAWAFAYGLSLGNHLTASLLLPAMLFYVVSSRHRRRLGWREAALALGCFLLGLSIYLYLPWRALAKPFPNWGDPVTLRRFLWMASAALYRHYVFALPLGYLPMRLATWAGELARQFGPWGVSLGLVGIWALASRARREFAFTTGVFALYSVYAIGYNTADSFVYLIPAYIIWAVWIGRGTLYALELAVLAPSAASPLLGKKRTVLAFVGLVLLPLFSVFWNWAALDLSHDHEARDYADEILNALPPSAVVISAADNHTFALWYAQQVEKRRLDVIVLDRDLLPYMWYRDSVLPRYPQLNVPTEDTPASEWLTSFLDANISHLPIFLTDADERLMARYQAKPEGQTYRLTKR